MTNERRKALIEETLGKLVALPDSNGEMSTDEARAVLETFAEALTKDALVVGDKMRWSLELLRACLPDDHYRDVVVLVKEITQWSDGLKVVAMERADDEGLAGQ